MRLVMATDIYWYEVYTYFKCLGYLPDWTIVTEMKSGLGSTLDISYNWEKMKWERKVHSLTRGKPISGNSMQSCRASTLKSQQQCRMDSIEFFLCKFYIIIRLNNSLPATWQKQDILSVVEKSGLTYTQH